MPNSLIIKIQDGGSRHVEFRQMFSRLDEDISTDFGEQMRHGHMEMIA